MDLDNLRLIANPYRLLKETKTYPKISVSCDTQLIQWIQEKYKGIYLNPCFLTQIIQQIDTMVQDNLIDSVVDDIVTQSIEGALTDVQRDNEIHIPLET